MYSKQEATQLKHGFWTAFGQYMAPIRSSEGERVNWINYKTGEKAISFKMNADNKTATIGIEIWNQDKDIQQIYFEQFVQFKSLLEDIMGEKWNWLLHGYTDNKIVSKIYKEISGVSVFKKEDWPELISFFKPRIIGLDQFWNDIKYNFENLR